MNAICANEISPSRLRNHSSRAYIYMQLTFGQFFLPLFRIRKWITVGLLLQIGKFLYKHHSFFGSFLFYVRTLKFSRGFFSLSSLLAFHIIFCLAEWKFFSPCFLYIKNNSNNLLMIQLKTMTAMRFLRFFLLQFNGKRNFFPIKEVTEYIWIIF